MRGRSATAEVARWEFRRFYRAKELVWGLTIILAVFLIQKIVSGRIAAEAAGGRTLAVIGLDLVPPEALEQERFGFVAWPSDEASLMTAVQDREHDGALIFRDPDTAELLVRKEAPWQSELTALLVAGRQAHKLRESGLHGEVIADLATTLRLETSLVVGDGATSKANKVSAFVMVILMLVGIMLGNSYLFVAITGEKTQRITEQIMATIRPQNWIDGKILGLALLSLAHLLAYTLGFVAFRLICMLAWGEGIGLPRVLADPAVFGGTLVLVLLGFYMWFCFFGLVACTISDPNNSSRSSLIMLPMLPLGIAFAGLGSPDVFWMRLLSILPLSSPSVMPVRLVLGEAEVWEFALAVVLLVVAIWFMRRAAGLIFGLGMLMYGKEPSLREIRRWLREG
ncbi:MAG: ABC transporter permease [Acidobacteriota bacterium]